MTGDLEVIRGRSDSGFPVPAGSPEVDPIAVRKAREARQRVASLAFSTKARTSARSS